MLDLSKPVTLKCDVYEKIAFTFRVNDSHFLLESETGGYKYRYGVAAAIAFCNQYRAEKKEACEIAFETLPAWVWHGREALRFQYGAYKPLPDFITEALKGFVGAKYNDHFLHISKNDQNCVAYTASHKDGVLDRQVKTTFERYLTKFYSEFMKPHEIRDFAAAIHKEDYAVEIGSTREDFRFAFEDQALNSPSSNYRSCMSYAKNDHHYARGLPCHPAEVYAAGDLQIAFIRNPLNRGQVMARTIIYPAKNRYSKIYAVSAQVHNIMQKLLEDQGLEYEVDLDGAMLLKIPYGDSFVMPYIDGDSQYVRDGDNVFVIQDDKNGACGEADRTNGTFDYAEEEPEYICENCEDGFDDNATEVCISQHRRGRQAIWCEYCVENNAFYCEATNNHYSNDEFTSIEVYYQNGRRQNTRTVCLERAEDSFFECQATGDYFCSETYTAIEVETSEGEQTWCEEENEDNFFHCEHTDRNYSCDDFTKISVFINEDGTEEVWCKEENEGDFFRCEIGDVFYSYAAFNPVEVRRLNGTIETYCAEDCKDSYFFCEYMNKNLHVEFLKGMRQ